MLRALVWKEWRAQRQVVVAGLAMAVLFPLLIIAVGASFASSSSVRETSEMIPFLLAAVVWPMFAAIAGASANAEEAQGDSLAFLFSRPVSRAKVWLVKAAMAAVAVTVVVAVSFWLAQLIDFWTGGSGQRFPFSSDPIASGFSTDDVRVGVFGVVVVAFAAAVFFSTIVRRAIAAVGLGLAAALGTTAIAFFFARATASVPWGAAERFLLGLTAVAALIFLGGSLHLFSAGGGLRGGAVGRAVGLASGGMIVTFVFAAIALAVFATRIDPEAGQLFEAAIPGGDAIVVYAREDSFAGGALFVAEPGAPTRRLTGRLSHTAAVTPDGQRVVYLSHRGPLGLRGSRCAVRSVRIDGTDDRLLAGSRGWSPRVLLESGVRGCSGELAISQDGERVAALLFRSWLAIARVDGRAEPKVLDLRPAMGGRTFGGQGRTIAWLDADSKIVLRGPAEVFLLDVETNAIAPLRGNEVGPQPASRYLYGAAGSNVLLHESYPPVVGEEDAGSFGLQRADPSADDQTRRSAWKLVDIARGTGEILPPHCGGYQTIEFSADGARLFYPACPNEYETATAIIVRDVATGAERRIAKIDGRVFSLRPSPDGQRLYVFASQRDGLASPSPRGSTTRRRSRPHHFLVSVDGTFNELSLGNGWGVNSWVDARRLVISRRGNAFYAASTIARRDAAFTTAYLDTDSEELTIVAESRRER